MGRILGIDYGNKRIGLAVTDPLKIFASPLDTVRTVDFEKYLANYMMTETIDELVIGYPVQMNNNPSESVKYIDPFLKRMKKLLPDTPTHLVDERFTSKMAFQVLIEGGVKKKDRRDKSLVDKISAAIILQSFLDSRLHKKQIL